MKPQHGTATGYRSQGCRCDECKAAHAEKVRQEQRARASRPVPDHVHGNNGYRNYACRCDICCTAHSERMKARNRSSEKPKVPEAPKQGREMSPNYARKKFNQERLKQFLAELQQRD